MSTEVPPPSVNNTTEGSELEQAVDALAKMGLKAEKEMKSKELCQIVPLPSSPEKTTEESKQTKCEGENKKENDENKQSSNQANCSACMKIIHNPISEGHGIVHGHVGQFKMLIPWTREADDGGVLCSRCYQRNWRLNKQRAMSEEHDTHEETPREPYLCLCGMTFHSSQLKAAHCRLCQKYREVADQEQRQEGKGSPSKTNNKDCGGQKRPRPFSEIPVRRSSEPSTSKKEHMDVIFSTPPPTKIRSVETTPVSCFVTPQQDNIIPSSPSSSLMSGLSCKSNGNTSSFVAQKLEVAQLLLTARLLGQVDFIQYANLAKMIANTTEKALLTEVSQLVMNFALKPLICSTQIFGTPSASKLSCFENDDKHFSSLSLLPQVMLHSMK